MPKMTCLAAVALLVGSARLGACAQAEFDAIDARARATPSAASTSVDSLASYLTAPASSEREKARALFTWIALNIDYDVSCFGEAPNPESVLETRRAVCAGYAALFKALAEAAGLEAQVIHGYAKGVGPPAAIEPDGLLVHDWNAVRIDGDWRLLDCTWGAGRLDEQGGFRKHFCDHYFLTPAELFVYDHLPSDRRWQLLDTPISRHEFASRVWVQPPFFERRLRLVSHQARAIEVDESVGITIWAPEDTAVVASLSRNGWNLDERHTFSQREADGYLVRAVFPAPGEYLLRIYAREQAASGPEYEAALEYTVRAGRSTDEVFPKMYSSFQERRCHLVAPISGVLKPDAPTDFQLRAPGADDIIVGVNGLARHLARTGDGAFSGTVVVERGQAGVFARFAGSTRYEGLLRYDVR